MKRRVKAISCVLGPVSLCLDDVRELVRIMRQIPGEGQLHIRSADYEFSSVDELTDVKTSVLRELTIQYGPWDSSVRVSIDESRALLLSGQNTPVHKGVHAEIEELLESRQRVWNWLDRWWVHVIVTSLVSTGSTIIPLAIVVEIPRLLRLGLGIAALGLVLFLTVMAARKLGKSVIVLHERSEQESFWQRNKDKIALVLITALVTMIFSVIGTLVVLAITGVNPLLTVP